MQNHALRQEYIARINRVMDYIESYPDRELSLAELASVANFSPFHFHRIFGVFVGERLNQFIQRIRLEKAANLLKADPKKSITEIAFDCGYAGSASFARAFKDFFGMTASQWRASPCQESKTGKTNRKNGQTDRKPGKEIEMPPEYIVPDHNIHQRRNFMKMQMLDEDRIQIDVRKIDPIPVAYVRHIGPYAGNAELFEGLYEKIFKWAGPRGLLNFPETQVICVYHDNPEVTDEDKLRTSVCISVPEDTAVDGEIGKMTIPGGKYAVAHVEIAVHEYEAAWNALIGRWLPDSGYQPDDGICFEVGLNDPKEHPEGKHIVEIYMPVKPM